MKQMVNITIDGVKINVPTDFTVLEAAQTIGVKIPRLCYHPDLSLEGACRICVVEVKGMRNLPASCCLPVTEGMEVITSSPKLRQIRRDILELILDNHPKDCQICERDGNCELQAYAYELGVRKRHFEGEKKHYENDFSSPAVIRVPNKCILCGRCVRVCNEMQGVTALGYAHRGFKSVVVPAFEDNFTDSVCTTCGQCINVCPTAAFLETDATNEIWDALGDPEKIVVAQVAPSVRAAVGEGFGAPAGKLYEKQIVTALKRMGVNYVFDTQFGADLTIMEEASELIYRITSGEKKLPMLTSCSAAWMKYVEQFYPELIDNISTCKSPMSMVGAIVKTYFAMKIGVDPSKIFCMSVMCCTAKKYEAARPEFKDKSGNKYVDSVITTREFVWMVKSMGLDFLNLPQTDFDNPFGYSSGAAAIFGATGGVMEAAVRTAYEKITEEKLVDIEFENLRGLTGTKIAAIDLPDRQLRVAVVHGLGNAYRLLDDVIAGKEQLDFIEIMGCPGGCIGGGGQPYPSKPFLPFDKDLLQKRIQALHGLDREKTIRRSHDNPAIIRLYKEFLGEPLGHKAHELLHTSYSQKYPTGVIHTKKVDLNEIFVPDNHKDDEKWVALVDKIKKLTIVDDDSFSVLIPSLHAVQTIWTYIPRDVIEFLSFSLNIPTAHIYGVVTFYHFFTLIPSGKNVISLCLGTACYVKGAGKILDKIKDILKIDIDETTEDNNFTLKSTRCVGACGLAPVMLVNEDVYGNITDKDIPDIIKKYVPSS